MLLSIPGLCFLGLGVGGLSSEYTLLLLIGLDRVVAMLLLISLSFEFLFFGVGRFGAERAGGRFISLEPERCGAFIVLLGGTGLFTVRIGGVGLFTVRVGGVGAFLGGGVGLDDCLCC